MASLIYLPTIYICIIILSGWHLKYKLYLLHAHLYTHVLQYTRWWDWCITRYPYHTLLHLYSQGHQGWAEGSQPRKAHIQHIRHPARYIYTAAIVTSSLLEIYEGSDVPSQCMTSAMVLE